MKPMNPADGIDNKPPRKTSISANTPENTGNQALDHTPVPGKPASSPDHATGMPSATRYSPADARSDKSPTPTTFLPMSTAAAGAGPSATGGDSVQPRRRGRRLRTLNHVKGGIAHLIRELEAGRLEPKAANALTYAYSALAGVMGADVTKELQEMQHSLETLGTKGGRLDA